MNGRPEAMRSACCLVVSGEEGLDGRELLSLQCAHNIRQVGMSGLRAVEHAWRDESCLMSGVI